VWNVNIQSIVFLTKRDIRHHGGGGDIYVHEIAKRMVKRYNVKILTSNFPGGRNRETIDGVTVRRFSRNYTQTRAMIPLYLIRHRNEFDFVVDNVTVLPWMTPLYVSKPTTAIIHQLIRELFLYELPAPINRIAVELEPSFYRPYRNIPIVCPGGESTAETLAEVGIPREHVRVIVGGAPGEYVANSSGTWSQKASFPMIVMLTRLEPYKRVDLAIRALSFLRKELPKVKLFVVGWGKLEAMLKELARSLGLHDCVVFTGPLFGKSKFDILTKAHVHMWSLAPRDGCGLSIMEAFACGTPSVAWNVPGPKDTIQHGKTGFLLPYADIRALADALRVILTDDSLRRRLSTEARLWASMHTWEHVAAEFIRHVEETTFRWSQRAPRSYYSSRNK